MNRKKTGLVLGPLLFALLMLFFRPEGLSDAGVSVLAATVWIASWWILEVIPIGVTALLPIILFPVLGVLSLTQTAVSFGHRYIFLYIGGFMLAIAIQRWNLHKRIAINIIYMIGSNLSRIVLGFMIATAFLSMWVSNTATAVMMLPIALAIVQQLSDNPATPQNEKIIFGKVLMLSVAYSASIGGIATLIGSPVNLVLVGMVQETYQMEISFVQWLSIGLPFSLVLLFIGWKYLTVFAYRLPVERFVRGREEMRQQLQALGVMSPQEKKVLVIFVITALAWIGRSFFLDRFIPNLDDPIIGVAAAVLLFLVPAGKTWDRPLLQWEEAVKLPWDVLLLFGGGLALAEGFKSSGLADWIGSQMALMNGLNTFILLLAVIAAINFLTEVTSNLATIAMILPVLAPLAVILEVPPMLFMVPATIAASCAFMLPVATPPNAVVFGSGYLTVSDMAKTGLWMNVLSILLLSLFAYFLLPLLWNLNLQ